jgi:hypothetical protein
MGIYEIRWHDCQDDCSGTPFDVEAEDVVEAYRKAGETIRSWSPYLN